jgi:hypothetical protein
MSHGTFNPGPDVTCLVSDVRQNTAKVAQALTNFIQQNGDARVTGQVYQSMPFVEVRWRWLIFPSCLCAIVLAALIATILQTRRARAPVWKYSPFPLLFNYHDRDSCVDSRDGDGEGGEEAGAGSSSSGTQVDFVLDAVTASGFEEMAEETFLRLRPIAGS